MSHNEKDSSSEVGETAGVATPTNVQQCPQCGASQPTLPSSAPLVTAFTVPSSVAALLAGASTWRVNWGDGARECC